MIQAAIIGISGYGETHFESLMDETAKKEMKIVGATVINQEEEEEKCDRLRKVGCRLFANYRDMLAELRDKVDLCVVPTGIYLHRRMTVDALNSGMNVLVEKPAAATVQDIRAMKRAEKGSGRFVAVGYQDMYDPNVHALKKMLCEGALGAIQCIKGRGMLVRDDDYLARNGWAGRLQVEKSWVMDSPYNNAMAHQLNLICFLAGERFGVSARPSAITAELYRAYDIESADTACMRIETREGPRLMFYVSICSKANISPQIEIRGDQGVAVWRHGGVNIRWYDGRHTRLTRPWSRWNARRRDDVSGESTRWRESSRSGSSILRRYGRRQRLIYKAVKERLRGEESFLCNLSIAGTQTICVNGAHESCAISTVPSHYVERLLDGPRARTAIRGVEDAILMACDEEVLFSETRVRWARPGKRVSLEGYRRFPSIHPGNVGVKSSKGA